MPINRLPPEECDDFDLPELQHWIFDEQGEPKAVGIFEYIRWARNNSNALRKDAVGRVEISTVLLMVSSSMFEQPPLIFETMIFGGEHDQYQYRYATKAEAIAGHERAVQLVREALAGKGDDETVSDWLRRRHPSLN